jgi:hypothetical protein
MPSKRFKGLKQKIMVTWPEKYQVEQIFHCLVWLLVFLVVSLCPFAVLQNFTVAPLCVTVVLFNTGAAAFGLQGCQAWHPCLHHLSNGHHELSGS